MAQYRAIFGRDLRLRNPGFGWHAVKSQSSSPPRILSGTKSTNGMHWFLVGAYVVRQAARGRVS